MNENQQLTLREKEILEHIGKGFSNKEIARHLNISHHTVKTHLHNIYVKVDKSGRIKAFHAHLEITHDKRSEDRI